MFVCSAAWLAQLVRRQSAVREVSGSIPGRTTTQSLKIIEEKVLPLLLHLQMVRLYTKNVTQVIAFIHSFVGHTFVEIPTKSCTTLSINNFSLNFVNMKHYCMH